MIIYMYVRSSYHQKCRGRSKIPLRRGAPTLQGGHQHMILLNFVKNCMKLRTFWAVRGARWGCPPKSATEMIMYHQRLCTRNVLV